MCLHNELVVGQTLSFVLGLTARKRQVAVRRSAAHRTWSGSQVPATCASEGGGVLSVDIPKLRTASKVRCRRVPGREPLQRTGLSDVKAGALLGLREECGGGSA